MYTLTRDNLQKLHGVIFDRQQRPYFDTMVTAPVTAEVHWIFCQLDDDVRFNLQSWTTRGCDVES